MPLALAEEDDAVGHWYQGLGLEMKEGWIARGRSQLTEDQEAIIGERAV